MFQEASALPYYGYSQMKLQWTDGRMNGRVDRGWKSGQYMLAKTLYGSLQDQHITTHMLEEMGQKFCEGLLRLGRGRTSYETNFSMPSESGLEQLGAYGHSPEYLYVFLSLIA